MAKLLIPTDTSQATLGYLLEDGTIVGSTSQAQDFDGTNGITVGTLALADGSITDSGGAISFGDENISTTGTLASGALTVTGAATVSTTLDIAANMAVGTGATLDAGTVIVAQNLASTDTSSAGMSLNVTNAATQTFLGLTIGIQGIAKWDGDGSIVISNNVFGLDYAAHNTSTVLGVNNLVGVRATLLTGASSTTTSATGLLLAQAFSVAPTTITAIDIPDFSHASTTTFYGLRIQSQTAATTTINISQEGTTGENRLAANTTIGANSAPTAGFALDVQGDAIVASREVNRYAYST